MRNIDLFKKYIKEVAENQRIQNAHWRWWRKESQNQKGPEPAEAEYIINGGQEYHLRCMYMAYGLLRGKAQEQIENKVKPGNELSLDGLVKDYMDKYAWSEEDVQIYNERINYKKEKAA